MGQKAVEKLGEKLRRATYKVFVALITSFVLTAAGFAQQASPPIVPDGNTQTSLATSGNVTNITTSTVNDNNAYNSFSTFNVNQNNTVNLILPGGTDNLLNLVHSQAMNVDGTLNSIKDGKIGGNVFFAKFARESLAKDMSTHAAVVSGYGALQVDSDDNEESTHSGGGHLFARGGLSVRRNSRLLTSHRTEWRARSFFLRTSNKLFRP